MGSLVAMTAGFTSPDDFSRTRKSFQISNSAELGWAHAATSENSELGLRIIDAIANEQPVLAKMAWGDAFGSSLANKDFAREVFKLFWGKKSLPSDPRAQAAINGWNKASQTSEGQQIYTRLWWESYVRPVIKEMQRKGWKNKRTLAAGVRLRNSSQTWMNRLFAHPGPESEAVEDTLNNYVSEKSHRADDRERILTWTEFSGTVDRWPAPSDVKWNSTGELASTSPSGGSAIQPGSGEGLPWQQPQQTAPGTATPEGKQGWGWWPVVVAGLAVAGTGAAAAAVGGAWWFFGRKKRKKRRR